LSLREAVGAGVRRSTRHRTGRRSPAATPIGNATTSQYPHPPLRGTFSRREKGTAIRIPAMPTVLVIDDNPTVATALDVLFSLHDIDTLGAQSPQAGMEQLQRHDIDLVIQDMNFHADTTSGEEGVALFHEIRARFPDLPVILLTAWTHLEAAVDLVKAGAADYLAKPWDDHKLMATVNNLLELGESRRDSSGRRAGERQRRESLRPEHDVRGLGFDDPASESTVALACQVARSEIPVLVTGPNGTGKERYAEILHANSGVRNGP